MYAYLIGFQYFRIGYATTVAIIFTLIVSLISGILLARVANR
jgi:ABC-type sugar transport system permease subunit